jgi:hypothetical protein
VLDAPIRALLAFFQSHLVLVTMISVLFVIAVNWYSRSSKGEDRKAS